MTRFGLFARLVSLALLAGAGGFGCSKEAGAGPEDAGAGDGSQERPLVLCPALEPGALADDAGSGPTSDEFGPNAPATKTASSMGRVNIYEVASPALLERVDVFLRADLEQSRVTIAVQEATARTAAFRKLTDIQIDVGTCQGWASSGPLAIPLEAGRFYAIGLDPNQAVTAFISVDNETLPIDGAFGRLIGSKAATSVSVPTITWEKFTDKEYNRQRLLTSPRAGDPAPDGAVPGDAATAPDGGDASPG
jgi:hypothetical protein